MNEAHFLNAKDTSIGNEVNCEGKDTRRTPYMSVYIDFKSVITSLLFILGIFGTFARKESGEGNVIIIDVVLVFVFIAVVVVVVAQ